MKKANTPEIDPNMPFLRRYRRVMALSTILGSLTAAVVMLFTPPKYQATAVICLPQGVVSHSTSARVQSHALDVETPGRLPIANCKCIARQVSLDSPELEVLSFESTSSPECLPEIVEDWAEISVSKFGSQAKVVSQATQSFIVGPKKAEYVFDGTLLGLLIGLGIACICDEFRQIFQTQATSENISVDVATTAEDVLRNEA